MFCESWGMQVPCYCLEIPHHQEAQRMLFPANKQILPKYQKGFCVCKNENSAQVQLKCFGLLVTTQSHL